MRTRGALPIYCAHFFLTTALGVVFVFLEDVQEELGLADWGIGVIAGTGFLAALFANLALAPLADRGRTAQLAVLGVVTGVIGPIMFAFGGDTTVLAIGCGLTGIGLGLFGLAARKALIGEDAEGGGIKLGILLSVAVAGFILGPFIGAALEPISFEAPFIFVATAIGVAGVPATVAIAAAPIASTPVDYSDLGKLIRRPRVQSAMLAAVLVYSYIGVFDATLDRLITDLGGDTASVAVAIVFTGGPMLVLPRIVGGLAERRGASTLMVPALLLLVPVMLGYWWAGAVWFVAFTGFLHGSGESFVIVSAQVLSLEVTGAERAAIGTGLLDSAGLLAAAIGAFVGPILYGSVGQTAFLWTFLFGVFLGALILQRASKAVYDDEPAPSVLGT